MQKTRKLREEIINYLKLLWKKALIVFGAISAALSFIAIFFQSIFCPWYFIASIGLGLVIAIIWVRIDSGTSSASKLDISERVGSNRSLNDVYPDKSHVLTYIMRQDLLDYKVQLKQKGHEVNGRDFISIRILEGYNTSKIATDGIVYLECSEYKAFSRDIKIVAYDMQTSKRLKVDFLGLEPKKKYTDFPFKIYFQKPLKTGENFKIAFSITLKNELDVLTDDDEIMSICILRYKKGVEKIDFNVCLDFEPQSVNVLFLKKINENVFEFTENDLTVEKYIPTSKWEKMFNIQWSSQPYIIRWGCSNPRRKLYVINYRR